MNPYFPVDNLPTSGQTQGITALPTMDGTGVLAQFNQKLWKFSCDSSTCFWTTLNQELSPPVFHSVAMHLPILADGHTWCETPLSTTPTTNAVTTATSPTNSITTEYTGT